MLHRYVIDVSNLFGAVFALSRFCSDGFDLHELQFRTPLLDLSLLYVVLMRYFRNVLFIQFLIGVESRGTNSTFEIASFSIYSDGGTMVI